MGDLLADRRVIGFMIGVGCLVLLYNSVYSSTALDVAMYGSTTILGVETVKRVSNDLAKSGAYRCPTVDPNAKDLQKFFQSQSGEDKVLLSFFNGLCGGTYIEMGAADGVRYSNSHYFSKNAGWAGLMVELVPTFFEKLVVNRPNELALVNAAVCGEPRTLHYISNRWVSGVWEFSTPSFRERWWKGITFDQTTEVRCLPLQTVIEENIGGPAYFDFFSLDVEGAEFEALQSLDFDKVGFGVLLVESDPHNELKNMALRTFLEQKGYTFIKDELRSWWFVNKNFGAIYHHILYPKN